MQEKRLLLSILFAVVTLWCGFVDNVYASQASSKRVVSLAPSLTEGLYLLGAEDGLVGDTTYCVTPDAAKYKEKIGTITNIDLERIVTLKPDIVLATSLTNPKTVQKLKDLGIEVKIFPAPKDFISLCDQFIELGKAVEKVTKAKEIVAVAREKVAGIQARTAGLFKPKVFIQIGSKPLFTANKSYVVSDFVELAGGINIAKDAKVGTYSREDVVRKNADVIIIVTMGIAAEKEKESWQRLRALNAVRNNKIYILDSRKVCGPTPVTFVETLDKVASLLHPELLEDRK